MKNKKLIMAGAGAIIVFILINIFGNLSAKKSSNKLQLDNLDIGSPLPVVMGAPLKDIINANMYSNKLQVGNSIVSMPCTVNEMIAAGTIVERVDEYNDAAVTDIKTNFIMNSNDEILLRFTTLLTDNVFYAKAINYTYTSNLLGDCIITSITFPINEMEDKTNYGLYIGGGVTVGDSISTVTEKYGDTYITGIEDENLEYDKEKYITYKYVLSGDKSTDYIYPAYYVTYNRTTNNVAGITAYYQGLSNNIEELETYDTKKSYTEGYYDEVGYKFDTAAGLCINLNPLDSRKTIVTINGEKYFLSMITSDFDNNNIFNYYNWKESMQNEKTKPLSPGYCESDYTNGYYFMNGFDFLDAYSETLDNPGYSLTEEEFAGWLKNMYKGSITCVENSGATKCFILNYDLKSAYISEIGFSKDTYRSYAISYLIKPMGNSQDVSKAAKDYIDFLSQTFAKTYSKS